MVWIITLVSTHLFAFLCGWAFCNWKFFAYRRKNAIIRDKQQEAISQLLQQANNKAVNRRTMWD